MSSRVSKLVYGNRITNSVRQGSRRRFCRRNVYATERWTKWGKGTKRQTQPHEVQDEDIVTYKQQHDTERRKLTAENGQGAFTRNESKRLGSNDISKTTFYIEYIAIVDRIAIACRWQRNPWGGIRGGLKFARADSTGSGKAKA